jgi:nucleoside-diphosphate-sugar epimerase
LKILLTGANGFTGRHFTALAQEKGHDVVALKADVTQAEALKAEVAAVQPTYVVHLAAISFVGHADVHAFYGVNLFGTLNLLNAMTALEKAPRSVVIASSANVYGNCIASPIPETQTPAPSNHYGISKLAMEHMTRTFADALPIVITRPFNYTGPGQDLTFVIPKLIDHFSRRAQSIQLGDVSVEREFNDVLFVCEAYLQLLEHGAPGETYNVCSGNPYTLQHVIDTLAGITGHHIKVEENPAFVRTNEVHRLCGNPARLRALIASHGIALSNPPLEHTLRRMLAAASISSSRLD